MPGGGAFIPNGVFDYPRKSLKPSKFDRHLINLSLTPLQRLQRSSYYFERKCLLSSFEKKYKRPGFITSDRVNTYLLKR